MMKSLLLVASGLSLCTPSAEARTFIFNVVHGPNEYLASICRVTDVKISEVALYANQKFLERSATPDNQTKGVTWECERGLCRLNVTQDEATAMEIQFTSGTVTGATVLVQIRDGYFEARGKELYSMRSSRMEQQAVTNCCGTPVVGQPSTPYGSPVDQFSAPCPSPCGVCAPTTCAPDYRCRTPCGACAPTEPPPDRSSSGESSTDATVPGFSTTAPSRPHYLAGVARLVAAKGHTLQSEIAHLEE